MDSFRTLFFAKCIDKNNKEGRVAEGSSIILKHKISVKGKNADLAPRRAHFALYCRTILCITIIIDDVQLLNTHSVYTTKKKERKNGQTRRNRANRFESTKQVWRMVLYIPKKLIVSIRLRFAQSHSYTTIAVHLYLYIK